MFGMCTVLQPATVKMDFIPRYFADLIYVKFETIFKVPSHF